MRRRAALAETVFGEMPLRVTAVGPGAMAMWQVFETSRGGTRRSR